MLICNFSLILLCKKPLWFYVIYNTVSHENNSLWRPSNLTNIGGNFLPRSSAQTFIDFQTSDALKSGIPNMWRINSLSGLSLFFFSQSSFEINIFSMTTVWEGCDEWYIINEGYNITKFYYSPLPVEISNNTG